MVIELTTLILGGVILILSSFTSGVLLTVFMATRAQRF